MFSVAENSHLTVKASVANLKISAAGNEKHAAEVGKIPVTPIISGCCAQTSPPAAAPYRYVL